MLWRNNMNKFLKLTFVITILPILLLSRSSSDIIQPITLKLGDTKQIFMNDLIYLTDYNINFLTNPYLSVEYEKSTKILTIYAKTNFAGFTSLNFISGQNKFSIPVFVKNPLQKTFKFNTKKKYKFVSIFGTFNDWNRNQLEMMPTENGYSTTINLESGIYQYKFFADGEEIVDHQNSDSISNGLGSFNSVLTIEEKSAKSFLHKSGIKESKDYFELIFISESKTELNIMNLFAFLDNSPLDVKDIYVKGNKIHLRVRKSEIVNETIVRVLYAENENISNIQSVFFNNSKIVDTQNQPNDWRNSIIYSLMIDRFFDGEKSINKPLVADSLFPQANFMGGDLYGVINKIDEGYFDSLSVNVIWLSPVYDNPENSYREFPEPHRWFSGYHGYWPKSFYEVEENFGTLETVKILVEKAHKHNIKILLDFVSHHAHAENPIYKFYPNWFGQLDLPDGRKNIRFWDEYRLTTWFEPYMPSFDFLSSEQAMEFMTENAIWWLENTNADGFRHDAVKHVPNEFWRELTKKIKQRKSEKIYQIGETFGSYDLVSSYVNNGQLDAQFNFNLYNTAQAVLIDSTQPFSGLMKEMEKTFEVYGVNHVMGNIMDSHDKNRYMSYADGDLKLEQWSAIEEGWNNPPQVDFTSSYKKAELYYAFMFTIPGLPVIYYGSEFGTTGASDPDNRRMMRFGKDLVDDEKKMLSEVREIARLKSENSALNYGDFYPILVGNDIFAYIRSDFNQRILVVLNKNNSKTQEFEITLPSILKLGKGKDLRTNKISKIDGNKLKISLPNISWKIFELE